MPKVRHAPDSANDAKLARVKFNLFSIVYSTFFVIKLATTPLLAYFTEPLPWSVPQQSFGVWDSFEAFNNDTYYHLSQIYNERSVNANRTTLLDSDTNIFFVRFKMMLPPNVPASGGLSMLVHFPGAIVFCKGIRDFVYAFLNQNATERKARTDLFKCQYVRYFSFPLDDTYAVYYGKVIWENITWCWFKLVFRCLLTMYILYVLRKQYYSHYKSLVDNLLAVGLNVKFCRYEIIIGDPTCLILSDPFVTVVMLIDVWLGGAYIGLSTVRVSQIDDLWSFALGCFYSSRFVWAGFAAMKLLSWLVQRFGLEATFSPVDPGLMSLAAALYGGPVFSLASRTPLMVMFHMMWTIFLPSSLHDEAIDVAPCPLD
ncbi:hypothetical protein AeMF1_017879 [Aphanomyces euteiches]|nr:hypothetical protein AeMF1_017879 [Aphanomyces euteiches]KAH9185187.1 hypothetical protein AeNC1_012839 [Aphanomyces euteiches]